MFFFQDNPTDTNPVKDIDINEGIEQLKNFSFNDFISDLSQRLVNFAIDVAIAIAVFYIGKFIIRRIYRIVTSVLVRRHVDNSLTTFILASSGLYYTSS